MLESEANNILLKDLLALGVCGREGWTEKWQKHEDGGQEVGGTKVTDINLQKFWHAVYRRRKRVRITPKFWKVLTKNEIANSKFTILHGKSGPSAQLSKFGGLVNEVCVQSGIPAYLLMEERSKSHFDKPTYTWCYYIVCTDLCAPTEVELCLALKKEEEEEHIHAELWGCSLATADHASKIHDRHLVFLAKLAKFQKLQVVFTPGAIHMMAIDNTQVDSEAPEVEAELIKLCMLLELSKIEWQISCLGGVVNLESTKARMLIAQVGERAQAYTNKYNQGHTALTHLSGADHAPHFRVLKATDMMLDGEEETSETVARMKLAMIGVGKGHARRAMSQAPPSSTAGALDDDEKALHESLRVEQSQTKVRKHRWEEEVLILPKKMCRVLRYLEWQSRWWLAQVSAGLQAYVQWQTALHTEPCDFFRTEWSQSIGEAAKSEVAESLEEGADLVHLFT
ncbi:hypothetical protein B0H19DRAFT_1084398 [Mycena capillaripes]|nr:hypothetical protein B0H19DRAFT_1084398 [Mycena capillaripes]